MDVFADFPLEANSDFPIAGWEKIMVQFRYYKQISLDRQVQCTGSGGHTLAKISAPAGILCSHYRRSLKDTGKLLFIN